MIAGRLRLFALATTVLITAAVATFPAAAATPTPPPQPAHGPGGADYAHLRVVAREMDQSAQGWWLFTPADPVPASAPVVVFCHGWGALEPDGYRAWIDHIVRRGNFVVWLNYQDSLRVPGAQFLPNAIAGVKAAFAYLDAGHAGTKPDWERVAVVGHSAGGLLSAELAAVAAQEGLPAFHAVMLVQPGDGSRDGKRRATIPAADLAPIPAATRLLVVVGADDHFAFEQLGLRIYDATVQVPPASKNVLELQTDRHGAPALVANHFAPAAPANAHAPRRDPSLFAEFEHAGAIDAMDWYGTWKLFDALGDCAFHDRECEVALGGSSAQTSMGTWSDGVPVKPMRVLR